jgi:hypothetical protein
MRLLNHHGRLVVDAVLDSLPVYAMGVLQLPTPPGLVDALRHAFLWVGEETVSGAQCLVS